MSEIERLNWIRGSDADPREDRQSRTEDHDGKSAAKRL
jgi:hypothetical protein